MTSSKEPQVFTATVRADGKITLPPEVLQALGVRTGGTVAFVCGEDSISLYHPAVLAMKQLQQGLAGEAKRTGLTSEEAIQQLVKEVRNEA